jgi:hypothetical protein
VVVEKNVSIPERFFDNHYNFQWFIIENRKGVNIQIASDPNNFEVFSPARAAIDNWLGIRRSIQNREALVMNFLRFHQNAILCAPCFIFRGNPSECGLLTGSNFDPVRSEW